VVASPVRPPDLAPLSESIGCESEYDELTPEQRRGRIATILGNALVRLHRRDALDGSGDDMENESSKNDAAQRKKADAGRK
jgi:hypothetical protein